MLLFGDIKHLLFNSKIEELEYKTTKDIQRARREIMDSSNSLVSINLPPETEIGRYSIKDFLSINRELRPKNKEDSTDIKYFTTVHHFIISLLKKFELQACVCIILVTDKYEQR